MKARWQAEKDAIGRIAALKQKLDEARTEMERAQREQAYERASQLQYGTLPGLERDLAAESDKLAEIQKDGAMLKEEVSEEDIAAIVSKWTGVPVSRMLEGEVHKLVHLEEPCTGASSARTTPSRRSPPPCAAPAPASRTRTGRWARSSSWARPASARPSWRARWPSPSSTTSGR